MSTGGGVLAMKEGAKPHGARGGAWVTLVAVLLAILLLYLSLRGIDWRRVWTILTGARLDYLGVVCLLSTVSYFVRSLRWRVLLGAHAALGILMVFWATMAGYLGNNFLPARAGEVIRSVMISSRSGLSKTFVLTTALAERLADAVFLVGLSSMLLLTFGGAGWMSGSAWRILVIAVVGLALLVAAPLLVERFNRGVGRLPVTESIRSRLTRFTGQAALGVQSFHDRGRLLTFSAMTLAIWGMDAVGAILAAQALGFDLPPAGALLLLAGLGLGSALPSTPGYIGIYQFVAVTVLTPFGFTRSDALAYILMAQFLGYVVIGFWGLLGIWRSRRS